MAIKFTNDNLDKPQIKQDLLKFNHNKSKKKFGCFPYLIILLIIGAFYQVGNKTENKFEPEKNKSNSSKDCAKIVNLGTSTFCLTDFENYKEVSNDNLLTKQRIISPDEILLAYYIDNDTYKNFVQSNVFYPNDIFKIYSLKILENEIITETDFLPFGIGFKKQFSTEWENSETLLEDLTQVNFDKPVLLKEYNIDNKKTTNTFVSLVRAIDGDEEIFTINIININLLKNKLIYSTYVSLYKNNEGISDAIQKNDYFLRRFLEIN